MIAWLAVFVGATLVAWWLLRFGAGIDAGNYNEGYLHGRALGREEGRDGLRISAGTADGQVPLVLVKSACCPACTPDPRDRAPDRPTSEDVGSVWICIGCAACGRIGPELVLRVPSEGELVALMFSPEWDGVEMVRRVILRRIEQCQQTPTR